MEKEIYENLFKNVVINGNYPLEKLNEMKSYIDTLIIKIDNLETQLKKQKETIDKLKSKIKVVKQYDFDRVGRYELLDILEDKEV